MERIKEMRDIAIYGAGGFGREIACLLNRINKVEPTWNLLGFFDDNVEMGKMISHFGPCIGNIDDLNDYEKELAVIISISQPDIIKSIVKKIYNDNIWFPNIVHPDFIISDLESFSIGKGNIIQGGCSVSCNVIFGDFNVFNGAVVFGHDDIIGSFNSFMPAVRVSGEVKIGDCNFFGVGSIVLQQLQVGNNVRLGAGSVMMIKPKDGCVYIGNPAKKFSF